MARLGLGRGWSCSFANDLDPRKVDSYEANFGAGDIVGGNVWDLDPLDLPGTADLAWASFPCQDVSLAGLRAGLAGSRSSAFYGFWRLIEALRDEGRAPKMIVLENVTGVLTSGEGRDLVALGETMAAAKYRFGALEIDAADFLPQSRPRLFIVGVLDGVHVPEHLFDRPNEARLGAFGRSSAVGAAVKRLPTEIAERWMWWNLPAPPKRNTDLMALLEPDDVDLDWRSAGETAKLLAMMGPRNRAKVDEALAAGERRVGAVFRRTRTEKGERVQRAEVRFDGLAGCLRTPAGGSSRQFVLDIDSGEVRLRALSPRETARLMGLPDDYTLPRATTAALHLTGDGVAVPAVRWLARHILDPIAAPHSVMAAE